MQAGQAEGLREVVVVETHQADVDTGSQADVEQDLVCGHRQRVGDAHDGPADTDPIDQGPHGLAGVGHVFWDDLLQGRVVPAELLCGGDPTGAPVVADGRPVWPAEVADRSITLIGQVPDTSGYACFAVDICPGGEARVVPNPPEGHERDVVLAKPARSRILVTGVGQHETADHLCGEQPLILANGVEIVLDGERDDVGILLSGSDRQLDEEGVLDVAEPAMAGCVQLDAQGVGLALAQGARREVGLEAQPFDLGPNFGQGLGRDLARIVHHVADGLSGDVSRKCDINERGPLLSLAAYRHRILTAQGVYVRFERSTLEWMVHPKDAHCQEGMPIRDPEGEDAVTHRAWATQGFSEPIPRQPWLHDLSVSVNGNVTALSARSGDMGSVEAGRWSATGAQGVYVDDRRALCVLAVHLGQESPVPVADASSGDCSDFFASARGLGNPGPDPTVEVRRHRSVTVQGITEVVEVVSRADEPVEIALVLHLAGDGAPISSVKSGAVAEALLPASTSVTGLSWRDDWHRTDVSFEPAPASLVAGGAGEASVAVFELLVHPGQSASAAITLRASRLRRSNLDADAGAALVDWTGVSVEALDHRLTRTVSAGLDDLRHLLLTDPEDRDSVFAAAGTPWYLTLFGRDSIWAARMALPFGTDLAAGTLRALARRQGARFNADSAEAPGKIPHELRRTTYVDPAQGLELPPVYYGTVDATPLWIILLRDAWKWGLPDRDVEALLPNLEAASRWLTDFAAPDEDGLLKYIDPSGKGLANQGWKDSGDSVRWRDGRIAEAPIALCEAQAYAVEAATAAAELLTYFNHDGAADLLDYADQMRTRFRERFWVGAEGARFIGLAVDGHGETVDGLGSNMGHVLGTGTLNGGEVDRVARTLASPALLGRYGIATLAQDNGGFNPIGYHTGSIWTHDTAIGAWGLAREGRRDEATRVAQSLLAAAEAFDYRWPELYAGAGVLDRPVPYPASCRPQAWSAASAAVLISVALGFEPDAPGGKLTLRPARPAAYGPMTVRGLRFAGQSFGVRCSEDGSTGVLDSPNGVDVVVV